MRKRQHRIVVDVSFEKPVSAGTARRTIAAVLDHSDKARILALYPSDITKIEVMSFERATRGDKDESDMQAGEEFAKQMMRHGS